MKKQIAVVMIAAMAVPVWAQNTADTRDKTRKGAVIGAAAGGVLGAVIGNNRGSGNAKRGAAVGAIAGTAVGAAVGAYMDKQERELRQIEGVEVYRTADDELNVVVRNEVLFDLNSAALRPASRTALRDMSDVFRRYNDTRISVEGHTCSLGSDSYNYGLSQRRAYSVADHLEQLGVSGHRIDTVAFGESRPRASNATEASRQLNRRVEIKIKANG
jgi:outer membrane protein OmpA-like peptidoglycan-associated protein